MSPVITSPAWTPIPKRSGLRAASASILLRWSTLPATIAAALSACRKAVARSVLSPNKAKSPSPSTSLHHCLRDSRQEAVDDEHGVERQPLLRHFGRAAHVDKHAREITFFAQVAPALAVDKGRVRLRRENGHQRNVALRPQLAGQTDRRIGASADALQHEGFSRRRPRQPAAIAMDANPAGGAAPLTAADARMR